MAEIMALKNRMDVMARDIENIQSGFVNHNNKNNGVQIFQGEGGLAAGVVILVALASLAINYKLKSEKYKKTAELFAKQVKNMNRPDVEERVLIGAIEKKVESEVFKILRHSPE